MKYLSIILAVLFAVTAQAQEMLGSTLLQRAMYGTEPGIRGIELTGRNDAVTTSFEPIWPQSAVYTFLTANMSSPTISSASANDTAAGTGARTARVTCVDENYVETVADYTLNGQSGVALTQNCMVVNQIEVLTAGSGTNNAGALYVGTGVITSGVPAAVHGIVAAARSISTSAIYGVPAGNKLLCSNFYASAYTGTAGAQEIVYQYSTNNGPFLTGPLTGFHNTAPLNISEYVVVFNEKTRVAFLVQSTAGTGPIHFAANCMLINIATNRQF